MTCPVCNGSCLDPDADGIKACSKCGGIGVLEELDVICPEHQKKLVKKRCEIRTGLMQVVRKIMIVGECPDEKCTYWVEVLPDGSTLQG